MDAFGIVAMNVEAGGFVEFGQILALEGWCIANLCPCPICLTP